MLCWWECVRRRRHVSRSGCSARASAGPSRCGTTARWQAMQRMRTGVRRPTNGGDDADDVAAADGRGELSGRACGKSAQVCADEADRPRGVGQDCPRWDSYNAIARVITSGGRCCPAFVVGGLKGSPCPATAFWQPSPVPIPRRPLLSPGKDEPTGTGKSQKLGMSVSRLS